jgi:hypothetical protein
VDPLFLFLQFPIFLQIFFRRLSGPAEDSDPLRNLSSDIDFVAVNFVGFDQTFIAGKSRFFSEKFRFSSFSLSLSFFGS